jgi:hypothetical protein
VLWHALPIKKVAPAAKTGYVSTGKFILIGYNWISISYSDKNVLFTNRTFGEKRPERPLYKSRIGPLMERLEQML